MDDSFPRIQPDEIAVGSVTAAVIVLDGMPRGAVIVLLDEPEPTSRMMVMNGLAQHGYESVAIHVPVGSSEATDEVETVLDWLTARGWVEEQVAVVGYGHGSVTALALARRHVLGAAVSVGLPLLTAVEPPRTPWLGMVGGEDSPSSRALLLRVERDLAASAPVYTQLVGYPGVPTDFYRDPVGVKAHAASFDCWQRTLEWLDARVVPRIEPRTGSTAS